MSMFTDSTMPLLIRPNRDFIPRQCIPARACALSFRSSHADAEFLDADTHTLVLSGHSVTQEAANKLKYRRFPDAPLVLDGNLVAEKIIVEIKSEVSRMKKSIDVVPGLAVILVGDNDDSLRYSLPCKLVGMKTHVACLAENCSEEEMLKSILAFNHDPCVHGIHVHLPLPSHMEEQNIFDAVSMEKDIDGFNSLNLGLLAMRGREPFFVPRAPKGWIEMLNHYNIEIKGKKVVVIGRCNRFGLPTAQLFQREDATVTIIHSRTKNPEEITRQADIVISAVGEPNMVKGSWIKPGAVIINVGEGFLRDPYAPLGFRFVGDICYDEVCKVASAITPLDDDGALIMELAMLLSNTLTSAKRTYNFL